MTTTALLRPSGLLARRIRLGESAVAAAEARGQVRDAIRAWEILADVDTAVLLADELVANAIKHTTGKAITLSIRYRNGQLRIDVHDTSPVMPAPADGSADAEGGRGLTLVNALSTDWGYYKTPSGKAVYFTLTCQMEALINDAGPGPEEGVRHAAASLLPGQLRPLAGGPRKRSASAWPTSPARHNRARAARRDHCDRILGTIPFHGCAPVTSARNRGQARGRAIVTTRGVLAACRIIAVAGYAAVLLTPTPYLLATEGGLIALFATVTGAAAWRRRKRPDQGNWPEG